MKTSRVIYFRRRREEILQTTSSHVRKGTKEDPGGGFSRVAQPVQSALSGADGALGHWKSKVYHGNVRRFMNEVALK